MRGAPAQVSVHSGNDLLAGQPGIFQQQAVGIHDHAGGAKAALHSAMLDKLLLKGMEFPILREPLNRRDLFAADFFHRKLARAHRLSVHDHGARTAEARAAAKFRAGEAQVASQHP